MYDDLNLESLGEYSNGVYLKNILSKPLKKFVRAFIQDCLKDKKYTVPFRESLTLVRYISQEEADKHTAPIKNFSKNDYLKNLANRLVLLKAVDHGLITETATSLFNEH